jgi:hypothetical protein
VQIGQNKRITVGIIWQQIHVYASGYKTEAREGHEPETGLLPQQKIQGHEGKNNKRYIPAVKKFLIQRQKIRQLGDKPGNKDGYQEKKRVGKQ